MTTLTNEDHDRAVLTDLTDKAHDVLEALRDSPRITMFVSSPRKSHGSEGVPMPTLRKLRRLGFIRFEHTPGCPVHIERGARFPMGPTGETRTAIIRATWHGAHHMTCRLALCGDARALEKLRAAGHTE